MANVKVSALTELATTPDVSDLLYIVDGAVLGKKITIANIFNSPALTTPDLGTPSAGNLGSCTAYPGDASLVTTGALNSGSITSGFGAIDNGASAITTTGTISATSFVGALTGNADTVTTITGLAPDTATTQATQAAITTAVNLVSVGALDSGSITSNFGTIDNGASSITTTGDITGGGIHVTGDTAIADNAALGYTAAEGLILTGQGTTNDITIKNDADVTVLAILTGTTEVDITGSMEIIHTAAMTDDHAVEVICDAAGFGDVKAFDIDYITGAIALGEDEGIILINIDETLSTGGDVFGYEILTTETASGSNVYGMKAGINVNPIGHFSGTFVDLDSILVIAVDQLTALSGGGAGNISVFVADNDTITLGDTVKFEELEFVLDTGASGAGIAPTFEFSTGVGTWTAFTPTDGTNGFRNTGVAIWDDADIPTWAVGTGSEFLIRITRTRNSLSTTPIVDLIQKATVIEYSWTKDGVINGNTVEVSGATAANDNAAMGYSAADGLILTGQGTTNDITLKNDADTTVLRIPTGSTGVTFAGVITATSPSFTTPVLGVPSSGDLSGCTAYEGTAVASTGEAGGTKFLREDGDGTCSWQAAAGGGSNALLDGSTHTDTLIGTVVRGDVIVGNATPAWARLAKGTANQILAMDGTATDVVWVTASGGGNVSNTGTPVNNQIAVWTSATVVEGTTGLTYATGNLTLAASDALTFGAVDILSDSAGTMTLSNIDALDATTDATITAAMPASSVTVSGFIEVATAAETDTGTDAARSVSPDGLAGSVHGVKYITFSLDSTTDHTLADGQKYFTVPSQFNGMNIVNVEATVDTAGITGVFDVQIHNLTATADILTIRLTVDSTERDSTTAATAAVISATEDDLTTADVLRLDVKAIHTGTAGKGATIVLTCQLP